MIGHRHLFGIVVVAVLASCSEPTMPRDDGTSVMHSREPTAAELAAMPPEFQFPTYIYRHDLSGSFQPGFALAQSILGYFASHAKIVLTLDLFSGNTVIGPRSTVVEERGDLLPARREFSAMVTAGVAGDCGHRFNANSAASIHNQFPTGPGSVTVWLTKTSSQTRAIEQGACPCGSGGYTGENGEMATSIAPSAPTFECSGENTGYTGGGGGGSSGSGGSWGTVTTTTCHGTHYYDADGNYLHSQIHYCEQSTSYTWISAA